MAMLKSRMEEDMEPLLTFFFWKANYGITYMVKIKKKEKLYKVYSKKVSPESTPCKYPCYGI